MAFFFDGGERSIVEYLQLVMLCGLWVLVLFGAWRRRHEPNAVTVILWLSAAALFLLIGREFSYGKYHGVSHGIRSALRYSSFAIVGLGLLMLARQCWPKRFDLWPRLKTLVVANSGLLGVMLLVTVVSQIVDKDVFFAIQPPLLAQALEESLESFVYILFGLFLWRVHASQPPSSAIGNPDRP
jgi:hypothetical protein